MAARAFLAALALSVVPLSYADGITKDQADDILKELRQIRQLLERAPAPAPAPAAVPAPAVENVSLSLTPGADPSLGRDDAPLTIVEYNDLQCPFCNRFHTSAFAEIRKQYIDTGKVRFVSRDLPLEELHPQALRAAQAARCAAEQGRFWEVADRIIRNQAGLSPESIDGHAREAGVDAAQYKTCIDSGKYVDAIRKSAADARSLGIAGTPSFVIGRVNGSTLEGRKVVGALPFASFDAVIKEMLPK